MRFLIAGEKLIFLIWQLIFGISCRKAVDLNPRLQWNSVNFVRLLKNEIIYL